MRTRFLSLSLFGISTIFFLLASEKNVSANLPPDPPPSIPCGTYTSKPCNTPCQEIFSKRHPTELLGCVQCQSTQDQINSQCAGKLGTDGTFCATRWTSVVVNGACQTKCQTQRAKCDSQTAVGC
jgi:hypothetical protein